MHAHGQKFNRVLSILSAAAIAGVLVTTVTSTPAVMAQAATTTIGLQGSIAGGIKTTSAGDTVTFVFTETNHGTTRVDEFLYDAKEVNTSVEVWQCVFPGGVASGGDGNTCEPDPGLKPGQSTSLVITTQVTGTVPGTSVSVEACTYNGLGGAPGPCKTLSAKIG